MLIKLLVSILVPTILSQVDGSTQCSVSQSSPVKVYISSQRNQTGHWISQVSVQQQANREKAGTSVEVEHSSSSCLGNWSTQNILLTLTAPPSIVASDYEFFVGLGYYKFHNVAKTFEQARQTCAEEGAHLAVINSEEESAVLKNMFSRFPSIVGIYHYLSWVGIQLIGNDHVSILGEALGDTGFTRWSPGQPTKGADGCVTINRSNGGLDDLGCYHTISFICEQ